VIRSNRSCGNCAGKTIRGIDVAALFVNRDSSGVWCSLFKCSQAIIVSGICTHNLLGLLQRHGSQASLHSRYDKSMTMFNVFLRRLVQGPTGIEQTRDDGDELRQQYVVSDVNGVKEVRSVVMMAM
jgi:hypothetical protein